MRQKTTLATLALASAASLGHAADGPWRATLEKRLPLLGHRNWIVVADSAYPWQTSPGVETIDTGADHLEVVRAVLDAVERAPHVRPIVYTDAELPLVPEAHAQGIAAYREALARLLGKREVQSLPHEQIIGKLDEAGKAFHVLLLKTTLTLPYTSVFLQLDCGYWSPEAERALRDAMRPSGKKTR
jgi:D-ribose pyranose/furanose isomerase RbsD